MNALKKIVLSVSCMAVAGISFAQTSTKMSLKECIQLAIKNNLDVQRATLQTESAKAYWQQARANLLPDLNANLSQGANQGRNINPYTNTYIDQNINVGNYSLSSNLTLFNGLSIQNNIKQNRTAFEASGMEQQQKKDNVTLNVILAYLTLLSNEDLLEVSKNQVEVSKKQVERLDILNKDGAITPSDLYDLKGQLANDNVSVVNNMNNMESARLSLAQLLNVNYSKDIDVERLTLDQINFVYDSSTENIYKTAAANLAIIKAVDLRQKSAVYGVKVAKGQQYPALVLSGGIGSNYSTAATTQELINTTYVDNGSYVEANGTKVPVWDPQNDYASHKIPFGDQFKNNRNTYFSLGLRIPILNAFQTRTKIRVAKIQQKDAEVVASSTRTQLQQNVEQAYVNMTSAEKRYKALSEQVDAYKESFRIAEVRFNAGAINSVDYLVAKNNFDRSNVNLIVARYDFVLRTKILDYYQGRPLW
ncbi:TolC family protein [Danxiaibacter flavus]|uniref:TolC family protein n=1 Tax=Danxiaibacter flavus TaxID=3049108 RepID=A0ABV3Z8L7_9BACT|nr:TolC family protein [Chitinophagaceae bacterium DXS]